MPTPSGDGRNSESPLFRWCALSPLIRGQRLREQTAGVRFFFRAQPGFFFQKKWGCIKKPLIRLFCGKPQKIHLPPRGRLTHPKTRKTARIACRFSFIYSSVSAVVSSGTVSSITGSSITGAGGFMISANSLPETFSFSMSTAATASSLSRCAQRMDSVFS